MISIRQEFVRLFLVATAPLLLVLGLAIYNEYQIEYLDAEQEALRVAEITAAATLDLVIDVRANLDYLARQPSVQAMDPARCGSAIKDLKSVDRRFVSVITTDREGYFICSATALPSDRKLRVVDLEMLHQIVERGEFRLSRPLQVRTTGRWVLSFANPVRDATGRIVGTVAIGVDLIGWQFLAKTPSLPDGSIISILSGDGTVIARTPRPEERIGRSSLGNAAGRAALKIRDGTGKGVNDAGEGRIFAFKPVPGTDWIVAVGFSLQVAYANSRRVLLQSTGLALLALLLAAFFALALKRRIVGPIRQMARVARAHAAGETETRVPIAGPSELVELAEDMNRSIDSRATAERALRRAQQMAKLSHVVTGPDGSFESWSDTLPVLIGIDPARMPKSTREWLDYLHPDDRAIFRDKAIEAGSKGTRTEVEYRLRCAEGGWIYIWQVMEPLHGQADAQGKVRWFNTLQDVTEQKKAEDRIRRLNRVYAVLSGINALIVRVRDREELFRDACRIAVEAGQFSKAWIGAIEHESECRFVTGHGADSRHFEALGAVLSKSYREGKGIVAQAVLERRPMVSNVLEHDLRVLGREAAFATGSRSLVVLPLVVEGQIAWVFVLHAPTPEFFDDEEMNLLLELSGDISFALDGIKKAEKLDYLAYYDQVTGLANRTLFHERLEQALAAAGREGHKLALIILDIERFKAINDTLGRQAGDALLKQIASRMADNAPDIARLSRIGADHFAIMAPDIQDGDDLARLTEQRLEKFFGQPFRVGQNESRLAAKLGIAVFPGDGADAETLFRNAEAALKKAKASGDRFLFYTQEMNERVAEKVALENKLRQAVERGEFVLHYQPKVDLGTRSIVGVEALIRWQSPELGLVPPMKFIHLLEQTGLILPVGAWALKRASLDHRGWVNQGLKAPRVAVNVSPIQLRQRDFVDSVEQAIMEGVAPTGIDLEITESLIMEDIQGSIAKLTSVRGLGVTIAIDDFGTGYSSLGYLAKLPVQTLKIDRSFITTMLNDAGTMTLVQTMISLAHSLKLKVVAEGVEAEEQAKILHLLRCDEMQGYLFSKPLPLEAITALLKEPG